MSFSIRTIQTTDQAVWAKMRKALWPDVSLQQINTEITNQLEDEKCLAYLVIAKDADETAIGFAEITIRDYANGCTQQPVPFLEGIWIDASFRRTGAGRALIDRITQDLADQGYVELCSDILENNHQSHKAHENWGFEETERVIYFRKSLA